MSSAARAPHITARQRAADVANLARARAALKGRVRTPRQIAASRRNLARARAARHARAQGKTPAPRKAAQAPAPGTRTLSGDLGELLTLPACGPVALAEHLRAHTGAVASTADILALWLATEPAALGELFEAARDIGLGGHRLAYFEQYDPETDMPGLVYGISLGTGRYHAALAVPGGMISWCRVVPRNGTPEEAWHLEWEGT